MLQGPSKWHEEFPIAKDGVRQSPIDIVSEEAAADEGLNALTWKYATEDLKDIENTGSSFKINSEGDGSGKYFAFKSFIVLNTCFFILWVFFVE